MKDAIALTTIDLGPSAPDGERIKRRGARFAVSEARFAELKALGAVTDDVEMQEHRAKFNGADPRAFDHDQQRGPGGRRRKRRKAVRAPQAVEQPTEVEAEAPTDLPAEQDDQIG